MPKGNNAATGRSEIRIRDGYAVTKKPRGLLVRNDENVPFVPMEAIPQDGTFEPRYDTRCYSEIGSGTYFESGDLLVAKITPCFENGKQAIAVDMPSPFGYATTEVIPLHATDREQDKRFLFYFLLQPSVRSSLAERMEGSTARQRVPEDVLLDLEYPSFAVGDQSAIADALSLIRSAISFERACGVACTAIKRAAMRELFRRGLRHEPQKETAIGLIPESWIVSTLSELCTMQSGGTPPKGNPDLWKGPMPWVSAKDLKAVRLSDARDHITLEAAERYSKVAAADSVLALVRGMGLANGFALTLIGTPMAFNQDLKALTTRDRITGAFLMHALTYASERMLTNVSNAAHGTKRLTQSDLDHFCIPVPEPIEQSQIVTILDMVDTTIDLHRCKQTVLEELFKTLLNRLMTGELSVDDLDFSAIAHEDKRERAPV